MERPSKARRAVRTLGRILLVLGIAELTLDAGLLVRRFFLGLQTREQTKNDALWYEDDYLRARFAPSQKEVRIGPAPANVNSLGFRGAEPRGAPNKVICLGDSVTFGWGVPKDGDTYPAALDQMLGRRDFEVLNAGMPRWNSCDLMDLYVTRIAALHPRVLVILVGWNDVGYEILAPRVEVRRETTGDILWRTVRDSSSLGHVAEGVLRRVGDLKKSHEALQTRKTRRDAIHWERVEEFRRILTTLVQLTRRDGVQPVLVTLPHYLGPSIPESQKQKMVPYLLAWPDVGEQDWWRVVTRANAEIRGVARALAVPLADCETGIAPERFTDLAHLDGQGNRQLAACVARTLVPLLPPEDTL